MKSSLKIGMAILVVAIAAVAGASVFSMQTATNNVKPQVSATPTPSQTQTPTQTPTATQQPAQVTESPSVPTITISYNSHSRNLCGHYIVDISIINQGYSSFTTDPTKFFITAGGQNYAYSASSTKQYGLWTTTDVPNQGSYDGALVFDAPITVTSASLSYNGASYNIVYEVR